MKISLLIEKLQRIMKEEGDELIELHADWDKELLTVAWWQDCYDDKPYVKAVTMGDK